MIIGIDPDVTRSGMALIYPEHGIRLMTDPLWGVLALIERHSTGYHSPLHVVIEAGWKNKKGMAFLTRVRMIKGPFGGPDVIDQTIPRRAVDVGRNHAIGQQIEAFCLAHGISYELFVPTARTPKWDHEMMVKLTGIDVKRSNQEERDAVRAVYFSSQGKEVFRWK